jgi:dynamin 1-like protein
MIDLPGLTRIPLKGTHQTDQIEQITRDMASFYCSDERTIILCVMPAN